ncbi:MAG: PhzA/PhzB family protein [Candidatus Hodarchaeota archaeon]|nr:MAG: PhzA/PhzB family protein [Deltaproteobacteria bacterium]
MSKLAPCPSAKEQALREKNYQAVKAYMELEGVGHHEERLALCTEDVFFEVVSTKECLPERVVGKNKLRRRFLETEKFWAKYTYTNIEIIPTQYPETFFVECDAEGLIVNPMFSEPHPYKNYYMILFNVESGLIRDIRQFTNPMNLYHSFWKTLPDNIYGTGAGAYGGLKEAIAMAKF